MYGRYCKLRDNLKLKDSDVAKETNITPSTFSDWKKGKSSPNAEKLVKIARYLKTSVEYLVTGEDPSPAAGYNITPFEFEIIQVLRKSEHRNSILALLNLRDPNAQEKEKRGYSA